MTKRTFYEVVAFGSITELNFKVCEMIRSGWEVEGGVVIATTVPDLIRNPLEKPKLIFCQTLVK